MSRGIVIHLHYTQPQSASPPNHVGLHGDSKMGYMQEGLGSKRVGGGGKRVETNDTVLSSGEHA